jgi:LemA protein
MIATIILLIIISVIILYIINIYNTFIELRNKFENAFSQIEVQLKRRYDLIPNLIETVKGYMKYEKETMLAVTEARNTALQSLKTLQEQVGSEEATQQLALAESNLNNALGQLNIQMEAYPELKASENMMLFSEELASTENKVSFARQAYNDAVMEYNTYKQSFPMVLFANVFKHGSNAAPIEFADSKQIQDAPKVSFE